jgi:hypothetical protein
MVTPERIREAGEFVEWLRQSVHEQSLPANDRVRAAGSCYAIAQDHHHAIVFLIENRLYASSFALMRLAFEAYVRGIWISLCATDTQINKFLTKPNWEPPKINELLSDVEKTHGFEDKILSYLKNHSWKALCSYTHTGGLHIQRWNTSGGIEPNYLPAEVESILRLSELVGAMSVIGIAELGNKDELAFQVLNKIQEFN